MEQSKKIQIIANGKTFNVSEGISLPEFLETINLSIKTVVVERNQMALSPMDAKNILIQDGDSLEIVRVVAGG